MKIEKFKLEEWMNKFESSAKYDLTTTCIKPFSIEELCKDFPKEIMQAKLDYGSITGSEDLKQEISHLYNNINNNNITITHGAIGANQLIFLSLLESGDNVVSIVPTYQQHYSIPESIGAKVDLLFLDEKNQWLPDLEKLEKLVSSNTKLICLNNPNNPTGKVIPDEMLAKISNIAKKSNSWILSDEVYRGLNQIGNPYSKSITDIYEKGISVGSMSKTYSLPGLRLGWIASSSIDLIQEINHQRQYNTISVSILDEYFALIALKKRNIIEKRNIEIAKNGTNILKRWIEKEPLAECVIPNSATTAFVKYNIDIPSKEFCFNLQQKTGVAVLPGETMEVEGFFRIGFCAENLDVALELISDYMHSIY